MEMETNTESFPVPECLLAKTEKTCPVCKREVLPSRGDATAAADSRQEGREGQSAALGSDPLLCQYAESHSPQNMTEPSGFGDDGSGETDSSEAESEAKGTQYCGPAAASQGAGLQHHRHRVTRKVTCLLPFKTFV